MIPIHSDPLGCLVEIDQWNHCRFKAVSLSSKSTGVNDIGDISTMKNNVIWYYESILSYLSVGTNIIMKCSRIVMLQAGNDSIVSVNRLNRMI